MYQPVAKRKNLATGSLNMKIISFDISSISTGYSVVNNGRLIKSSCGLIKPDPKKTYGERLSFFSKEIERLIKMHLPDKVVVEDIFRGKNINSFKVLAMFRGVAIHTIYSIFGKDPVSLMASEARSLVGIKNKKEVAFEFINNKYKFSDFNFDTHNDIADSIILCLAANIMHKQGISEKSLKRKKRKRIKST